MNQLLEARPTPDDGTEARNAPRRPVARVGHRRRPTIAIIDDGFDIRNLSPLATVSTLDVTPTVGLPRSVDLDHGTRVAQLIVGDREGQLGVCSRCRLVLVRLPQICSNDQMVEAFDLARRAGADVVCCPWGALEHVSTSLSPEVYEAITRTARQGRAGRGALVIFAAPNRQRTTPDPYLDHPDVTIARAEPQRGGACATAALAAGLAAMMLTVDENTRLQNAERRLDALGLASRRSVLPSQHPLRSVHAQQSSPVPPDLLPPPPRSDLCRRDLRFLGGEHAYLGYLAANEVNRRYHTSGEDLETAYFGGPYARLNPPGHTHATYASPVAEHLRHVLGTSTEDSDEFDSFADWPSIRAFVAFDAFPMEAFPPQEAWEYRLPFALLIALAADIFGNPRALLNSSNGGIVIPSYAGKFFGEMDDLFERESEYFRSWFGAWTAHYVRYLLLAYRNYSHFVGDNLLFYLSYHLEAVALAQEAAALAGGSATGPGGDVGKVIDRAFVTEAFAAHFLTDMFSTGHARVPRWALLRGPEGEDQLISRILHEHDGRLGVLMTNSLGMVWYGYGDGGLDIHERISSSDAHAERGVYDADSRAVWSTAREPLGVSSALTTGQLLPSWLAADLVAVSLVDVIRHMADHVEAASSALGSIDEPRGALGYILDRAPYALGGDLDDDLGATMTQIVGEERFASRLLSDRLGPSHRDSLDRTIRSVNPALHLVKGGADVAARLTLLGSTGFRALRDQQIKHLVGSPVQHIFNLFADVPELISGTDRFPETFLTRGYDIVAGPMPEAWRDSLPTSFYSALTTHLSEDGTSTWPNGGLWD